MLPALLPPAFQGHNLQASLPSVVLEQLGTAVIGIVPPLHGQNPWTHLSSDRIIQKIFGQGLGGRQSYEGSSSVTGSDKDNSTI